MLDAQVTGRDQGFFSAILPLFEGKSALRLKLGRRLEINDGCLFPLRASQKVLYHIFSEYKDAFCLFDRDSNGYITTRELGSVMRSLGFNPTDQELQVMINSVDYDGNGVIDFPEFVKLMEDQKKPDEREADMMLAFRVFDADNKGYIESAELRYILLNMDKRIPREELQEMIVSAKLDEDKRVTYQEFLALLEPHGET
ncbi:neo-calmodulin-like [Stylophora pistillata]|nr:neo-calmodulin-like [Stylophora pistillata]